MNRRAFITTSAQAAAITALPINARSGAFVLSGTALWHNKGSAIHIEGDEVHDFTITGCRFSNNGTAAALGGAPGSLMGNTLLDNSIAFTGGEEVRNIQETNVILPASA